jgi:N-acyl-D-aspartate/D-glutamate deacylase
MCGFSPLAIAPHLDGITGQGAAVNYAVCIGHNTVRHHVMERRAGPPTPGELDHMRALVRQGLEQGALGLSTGLWYVPGVYAQLDEVVALVREVRPFGGVYASHVRSENATSGLEAIDEAVEVGRRADVPVQIAHLKAAEQAAWGQGRLRLERLERAQAAGIDVHADAYPYDASATSLNVCLPPEAFEGEGLKSRLDDPASARAYREHIRRRLANVGGPSQVLVTSARRTEVAGRRLDEAARILGLSVESAVLELVLAGPNSAIYFSMDQRDVDEIICHPLVMIGSDSSVRRVGEGLCHPRTWGTFPRTLARYVRQQGRLNWGGAIHKMTGQTAAKFGLRDRGVLRPGAWADVVLLDPHCVEDRATYGAPHAAPAGIHLVLVNGVPVVRDGQVTGALPGQVIRRDAR